MVAARAVFDIVRGQDDIGTTIGMLVSDSAGYVSFNLTPIWRSGRTTIPRLLIYCTAASEKPLDVTASLHLSGAQIDFVLHADPRASLPPSDRAKLPSIQEPDLQDWELSPRSFSLQRELVLGDGDCRIGAPPENVEQEFNFFRIVLEPEPGLLQSGQGRIDTLKDLTQLGRDDIIFGEVDEYRQRWYALGHSLGAIAYSLPLAPCESVDLAVIDWSRTDAGFRADAVTAVEDVDHDLKRDRTIEETVNAAIHEEQFGFSLLGGLSGAASVSIPIQVGQLSIGGNHALGGGLSMSKGDRNIGARSLQSLHDSVVQRTNRTRSLNSTVIYQATQAERNTLQTRTVTNHNHCHALTIEYYEVLRNLRVETCMLPRKPRRCVVLIPYSVVAFDWTTALSFRSVLQRALLDSLQAAFDAIVRLRKAPDVYKPVAPPAPLITTIAVPP